MGFLKSLKQLTVGPTISIRFCCASPSTSKSDIASEAETLLQALTMLVAPRAWRTRMLFTVSRESSSRGFSPYGAFLISPKYNTSQDGICSRIAFRSEERRVGKEGRSRWSPYH